MRCIISSCEFNSSSSTSQNITFHLFPTEPALREKWLKLLHMEGQQLAEDSAVCSKHFLKEDLCVSTGQCSVKSDDLPVSSDYGKMALDMKMCRVCFATNHRLYSMTKHKSLEQAYEIITELSLQNDILPPYVCTVCAQRLLNCFHFRNRSLLAHSLLLDVIKKHNVVTLGVLSSTIGNRNPFRSNLTVSNVRTDQYDLEIEHIEDSVHTTNNTGHHMLEDNVVNIKVEWDNSNTDMLPSGVKEHTIVHDIKVENEASGMLELTVVNIKAEREEEMDSPTMNDHSDWGGNYSSEAKQEADTISELQGGSYLKEIHVSASNIIQKHFTTQSDEKPYPCDVCTQRFSTKESVQQHMAVHSEDKPFSCELCYKGFNRKVNLKAHMIIHTGEKPFTCGTCNKSFNQKSTLNTHVRIHTGEKPFSCTVCKKAFGRKVNLTKHMMRHSGDLRYICELCNKSFGFRSELCAHRRKHSGERPYTCSVCSKSYSTMSILGIHMKTHSNEKPFICDICNKSYGNKTSLKNHLTTHTSDKPFTCEVCHKSFKEKSNFKQHCKVHSGEKPYSCNLCGKAFIGKANLRKHEIIHTGEKPFPCNICNRRFNKSNNRDKHMRVHAGKISN